MSKKSSRLEALQKVFAEHKITKDTIEWNDAIIQKIKKNANAVQDYRHPSYIRHPLGDIIMIVFLLCWEMQMNGVRLRYLPKRRKHGYANT